KTRRVHLARKLLDETPLPISRVAFEAGFLSIRAFNEAFRATFRKAPSDVRRGTRTNAAAPLSLRLPFRPPLDWTSLTGFLGARAIPGVEEVVDGVYRRTTSEGATGHLEVSPAPSGNALILDLFVGEPTHLVPM